MKEGFSFEKILEEKENIEKALGVYSLEKREEINKLKEKIKDIDEGKTKTSNTEKGEALERLVMLILEGVKCLEIKKNVRTSTNEIDLLVLLKQNGKIYRTQKIISEWFPDDILIECKNYKDAVGITYINKFHSLVKIIPDVKFGIFISNKGLKGNNIKGWTSATGLIKKIALISRYTDKEPFILPINCKQIEDFNYNFFDWISQIKIDFLLDIENEIQDFTSNSDVQEKGKKIQL